MTDQTRPSGPGPRAVPPIMFPKTVRSRRMYIPPVILHTLVAILGALLALGSSYTLRYFGY